MEEPIQGRAEQLGAWSEGCSWFGAGLWWSVPSLLAVGGAGSGRHRRQRPVHERVPLSQLEERALLDLEAGLDRAPRGADRAPGRAPRLLLVVLVLLVAAVVPIEGAGAAALGLVVLAAAAAAVAWARDGGARPDRLEERA